MGARESSAHSHGRRKINSAPALCSNFLFVVLEVPVVVVVVVVFVVFVFFVVFRLVVVSIFVEVSGPN